MNHSGISKMLGFRLYESFQNDRGKGQVREFYYNIKPLIPRRLQILLRRAFLVTKKKGVADSWPIDEHAGDHPLEWCGWPENKKFALVLTHDVDTQAGFDKCRELAQLEMDLGFRSSFNFVPQRYEISLDVFDFLRENGFEIGVHGLYHDGKLYKNRETFEARAAKINEYIDMWGAVGFRSPAMHHNLEWISLLNIEYDASTFDTDPFEPQSDGVKTIFPFFVESEIRPGGFVELPYTLPQDFTLFVLFKETGCITWKKKLDWLAAKGGMALLNTHPDYMNFKAKGSGFEEYPAKYYREFLMHIEDNFSGEYWSVLPREISRYWSNLRNTNPLERLAN